MGGIHIFKFEDLITKEEAAVMRAVVTRSLDGICGGDKKAINRLLDEARRINK